MKPENTVFLIRRPGNGGRGVSCADDRYVLGHLEVDVWVLLCGQEQMLVGSGLLVEAGTQQVALLVLGAEVLEAPQPVGQARWRAVLARPRDAVEEHGGGHQADEDVERRLRYARISYVSIQMERSGTASSWELAGALIDLRSVLLPPGALRGGHDRRRMCGFVGELLTALGGRRKPLFVVRPASLCDVS